MIELLLRLELKPPPPPTPKCRSDIFRSKIDLRAAPNSIKEDPSIIKLSCSIPKLKKQMKSNIV